MKNLIDGKTAAKLTLKTTIENPNGDLKKYLPIDANEPCTYKEVYFSELGPGRSKKWKCNKSQQQNLFVAFGRLSVICIELKGDTYFFEEFLLDNKEKSCVLEIPRGLIYGLFTDENGALVVNALHEVYSDHDAMTVDQTFEILPKLL